MKAIVLSEIRPLRPIVLWRWFPECVQALLLLAFLALVVLGWGLYTPDGVADKLYAKSNLVTLIVWGLWWPAMILVTVLLGRAWCAVCPLELVSRCGESLGRALGLRQHAPGKWMQAGWLILILYGIVQMLVVVVHLHRVPMYTSLYLIAMLALAAASGVLMKHRTYCGAVCPVGLLLKVFGRGGVLAIRATDAGAKLDAGVVQACKSLLNPGRLEQVHGDDCLMCLDCVQADRSSRRMQLQLRAPWSARDFRPAEANWPTTLFIMMVSGFVGYEISGLHPQTSAGFLWVPSRASAVLGFAETNSWIQGLWTLGVFPLALWTFIGVLGMAVARYGSLGVAWRRLALPVSLVVMAAHMTKAVEKLATWGGYLPLAIGDPEGAETAIGVTAKSMSAPGAILSMPAIVATGVMLLMAALYLMRREVLLGKPCAAAREWTDETALPSTETP